VRGEKTEMLNPEHLDLNADVSQVKNCHKNLKKTGKEELVKYKRLVLIC
jgi:hypothetical protein